MYFSFFYVESIRGFTSNFVAICYATSYPFGFPYRSKCTTLDTLKLIVTTLRNQDNKAALIQVDEYVALEKSSKFMRTYHNMNIIVQATGGYASSLNGKIEIPDNKLDNITRSLLLNSSQSIFFGFAYQYSICIYCRT